MELEKLLNFFPPRLFCSHGKPVAWFCLEATDEGYEASYLDEEGDIVNNLAAAGVTPVLALQELYRLTQVIDMLRLPAIRAEEDVTFLDRNSEEV